MKGTVGLNTAASGTGEMDLFEFSDRQRIEDKTEEEIAEDAPVKGWPAFWVWKDRPGANHVLKRCYARAAYWAGRRAWRRYKIPVSVKLIWEEVRQELKEGRIRAKSMGIDLRKFKGYAMPNELTAYVARHIMDRRDDWQGLFELREISEKSSGQDKLSG